MRRLMQLLFIAILVPLMASSKTVKTTLKRCIFRKQITMTASCNAVYPDKWLKLNLTNTTNDTLNITIDPALIFRPDDTVCQNMVAIGNETIAIAPAASQDIELKAFCGKSYGRCPYRNLKYTFWKQGDSAMVKTVNYMREKNVSNELMQNAIWRFTNNHSLRTVYDHRTPKASEDLIQFIAKEQKIKAPDIYTEFETDFKPGHQVFSPTGKAKTYVMVKWKHTDAPRHMNVTVLKENGEVYKRIYSNDQIDKEGHTVIVAFNSVNDSRGTYYVELKDDDGKIWDKQKVVVGYDATE